MREKGKRVAKHPKVGVQRGFLRSLSVADAGLLLHILDCPRCTELARKELRPKPVRRRKPKPEGAEGEE